MSITPATHTHARAIRAESYKFCSVLQKAAIFQLPRFFTMEHGIISNARSELYVFRYTIGKKRETVYSVCELIYTDIHGVLPLLPSCAQ